MRTLFLIIGTLSGASASGAPVEHAAQESRPFEKAVDVLDDEVRTGRGGYWIRVDGDWDADKSDAAQACDNLVRERMRSRGWKSKIDYEIFAMEVCLRAKGIQGVVIEREPNRRVK
jgi:hypothetical protein